MKESEFQPLKLLANDAASHFFSDLLMEVKRTGPSLTDKMRGFRAFLEDIYKEITKNETRSFRSLNEMMIFISETYNVARRIKDEANGLRVLFNELAHKRVQSNQEKYLASIQALAFVIYYFSSTSIPPEISQLLINFPDLTLIPPHRNPPETVSFDRAIVIKKTIIENSDSIELICESENDLGRYTLSLKDQLIEGEVKYYGQQFYQTGLIIWNFACINVFKISKDKNRENYFHVNYDSNLVIEPDFLMDATTLARAYFDKMTSTGLWIFRNPILPFVEKLNGVEPNKALFLGSVVNEFLDKILLEENFDFDESFTASLRDQVWNALNIGMDNLTVIKQELQTHHLSNLINARKELLRNDPIIEPAFFSSLYGIQGRLDLMSENQSQPFKKDIYELKSGSPPTDPAQVKIDHEMQVIAYNLLLNSTFENSRTGTSAILYSKATNTPLRNVNHNFRKEQDLLMIRNQLISIYFSISFGDYSLFEDLKRGNFGDSPPYQNQKENFTSIGEAYAKSSKLEKRYFEEYTSFIIRELQAGKVGDINPREGNRRGFSSLWHFSRQDKIERFEILEGLKFEKTIQTEGNNEYEFSFNFPPGQFSNFRSGDIAIIYPDEEKELRPLSYQILKCNVSQLSSSAVVLTLRNSQINQDWLKKHEKWVLEHDFLDKSYYSMMESMANFLKSSPEIKSRILGLTPPSFKETQSLDPDIITKEPSPSQVEAIKQAIAANDFFLIQGPPGTGKTSRVLTYILLHLFRHTKEKVVILAFTNKAVEKIMSELDKYNSIQNNPHPIDYIHLSSAFKESTKSLSAFAKGKSFRKIEDHLLKTRIFIGTLSSFQSHRNQFPSGLAFDTLIVDEASQLIEPQIAGIIPMFKKFILIGDHNQLPAISIQRDSNCTTIDESLNQIGISDLRVSLFERLWKQAKANEKKNSLNWKRSTIMLEEHYRMHEEIAFLVSPYYGGNLKPGNPIKQTAKLEKEPGSIHNITDLLKSNRLIFIESPKGKGKSHDIEAARVAKVLDALKSIYQGQKQFDHEESIGVITPWRAQINAILRKTNHDPELAHLTVDTVERFQGSERNTIILSMATSDKFYLRNLSSTANNELNIEVDRKLNVSLSRAEERLVILGEPRVLRGSQHYQRIIEAIMEKGAFISLENSFELFNDRTSTSVEIIF
ncbi:MAG: AAA family ATPase [Bacteroidia bacterium]|nr:AAA family ATPase [Bacteroidia bacterium]